MSFPKTTWRLIHTPAAPGAWNMAADEAILEAVGRGGVAPTLRLYAWSPTCLSLGYAQPVADVDRAALVERGWQLVRRPTGGRAILHTDELTYSVIGPPDEPRLAGSVLESYQRLSGALLRALQLLGIPAEVQAKSAAQGAPNPVCFEVPSNYEVTFGGKKLIGSAQARRREGVLQHGSLPLYGDLARITQVLHFADAAAQANAAERLLARAVTAEGALGYPPSWDLAARAFAAGFTQALDLELLPANLSPAEQTRAAELAGTKFGSREWTEKT